MATDTTEPALKACVSTPTSNYVKVQEDPVTYPTSQGVDFIRKTHNAHAVADRFKVWRRYYSA